MNSMHAAVRRAQRPWTNDGWRIIIAVAAIGVIWILPAVALHIAALATALLGACVLAGEAGGSAQGTVPAGVSLHRVEHIVNINMNRR